jgi:murein tripeptide amidase MpaA
MLPTLALAIFQLQSASAAAPSFAPSFAPILANGHASAQVVEPAASPTPEFHDGRSVLRATVRTARDVRTVLTLAADVLNHRIDVGPVDFIVDAKARAAFAKTGIPHEVLIEDLGPLLRAEFAARANRVEFRAGAGAGEGGGEGGVAGGTYFNDFRTLAETYAQLDAWIAARPDLVTPFVIGTSLEGRPIRGIRISKAPAGSPGVLFNATQHAREWGAQTTSMYIADQLIERYGTDPRVTALLDRAWIDVIPVCNPDGYVWSWTVDRLWRKNRRLNSDGTSGVDLNRNWAFQWGGGGASTVPNDPTYRGPSPFSEPESAALRDYFIAQTNLAGHIDFHAYSQFILSPWGYTTELPANNAAFIALGNDMKDAIARTSGLSYTVGPIASTLYIASGSSVDHAWGQHGVPSYTIEVRDTGSYGFVMPTGEIVPNASENFAAALELADATVDGAVIRLPGGAPVSVEYDVPATITAEVRAIRGNLAANGVVLRARVGSSGSFSEIPMTAGTPGIFTATLPTAACGATIEWYLTATTTVGTARLPEASGTVFTTELVESSIAFEDTFETNLGWVVGAAGDNATAGLWTRVDPIGTTAQPENDSSDAGVLCFVTGQGAVGGAAGSADVDGGTTTLVSPALDASDASATISYRRWYSNNLGGAPNADSMPVSISSDGINWVLLEDVTQNAGAWVERSFRVADYVTPGASVRVRFQARDLATGSLVEAGVDFVRVSSSACPSQPGDLDGDGDVDAADLATLLAGWGSAGATDLDGDGTTGASDLAILLGNWG